MTTTETTQEIDWAAAVWALRDTAHQLDAIIYPPADASLARHTEPEPLRAHAQRLVEFLLQTDEHIPAEFRDELTAASATASRAAYAGSRAGQSTGQYSAAKRCQEHCSALVNNLLGKANALAALNGLPVWTVAETMHAGHRRMVEFLVEEFAAAREAQVEFLQEHLGLEDDVPTVTSWCDAAADEALRQLGGANRNDRHDCERGGMQ